MSQVSKRLNLILGFTVIVLVIAVALLSNQSPYFKGLFYFESPKTDSIVKQDLQIPTPTAEQPTKLSITKSENTPSIIQFTGEKAENQLLGVFEITPEQDIANIDTIAASIAGEFLTPDPNSITAKIFLMHKPRCEEEAEILCGETPAPQAEFTTTATLVNEQAPNDIVVKMSPDQPFSIDKSDWRHEAIGDTYYLAIYGTLTKTPEFQNLKTGTLVTSIKYLGDTVGSYQTQGTPTAYTTTNIY